MDFLKEFNIDVRPTHRKDGAFRVELRKRFSNTDKMSAFLRRLSKENVEFCVTLSEKKAREWKITIGDMAFLKPLFENANLKDLDESKRQKIKFALEYWRSALG